MAATIDKLCYVGGSENKHALFSLEKGRFIRVYFYISSFLSFDLYIESQANHKFIYRYYLIGYPFSLQLLHKRVVERA